MTGTERIFYVCFAGGVTGISFWLIAETFRRRHNIEWNTMPFTRRVLVRTGRLGVYLFVTPITIVFSLLTISFIRNSPPSEFYLVLIAAGPLCVVGLLFITTSGLLLRHIYK
jgi:hypothetical protein